MRFHEESTEKLIAAARKASQFVIPRPEPDKYETGRGLRKQESILLSKSQWIPGQARNDSVWI
jgi:hypothetical protein